MQKLKEVNMSYFTNEDVIRVKEIDLLTYLQNYEPDNLKQVSGNVYRTVDHDSLVISNGKWCWFSQGIGGKSALDYLIKVRGMTFKDAVEKLLDSSPTMRSYTPTITAKKEFVMPPLSDTTWQVESYLKKRGIDAEIIKQCIQDGFIFETADYHNVLFVGYDKENNPRYGALRSTWSTFKGDARGSDKRFSFKLMPQEETTAVHIFESAPDLLSYATLIKMNGDDWRKSAYLSLAGISDAGQSIPRALEQLLKDYPHIHTVHLHLDNDPPGRKAAASITKALEGKAVCFDVPPPEGKDYNDYLKLEKAKQKPKKVEVR